MRQLEAEHKPLWDMIPNHSEDSGNTNDCDPALLSGWTDRNLSLWDVSSDSGKPGLQDILIAICRKKRDWEKISYILFPQEAVSLTGLSLTSCNGKTGDQWVDTSGTHFEIKNITGKELCTLIFHVTKNKFRTGIFKKTEMENILLDVYDKTNKKQVVNGNTSLTPDMSSPSSGSNKNISSELSKVQDTSSNGFRTTRHTTNSSSTQAPNEIQ